MGEKAIYFAVVKAKAHGHIAKRSQALCLSCWRSLQPPAVGCERERMGLTAILLHRSVE